MINKQFQINKYSNYPGVYILVNLDKEKVYVGSTRDILRRLKEHEAKLRKHKHENAEMQQDYDSGDMFIAYPLTKVHLLDSRCNKDANLRYFEKIAIEKFKANIPEFGYNKRLDPTKSPEKSEIEWEKTFFDYYFKHKKSLETSTGRKAEFDQEEMDEFIAGRLNKR